MWGVHELERGGRLLLEMWGVHELGREAACCWRWGVSMSWVGLATYLATRWRDVRKPVTQMKSGRAHCMLGNVPGKSLVLLTVLCAGEEAGLGRGNDSPLVMTGRWWGRDSGAEISKMTETLRMLLPLISH